MVYLFCYSFYIILSQTAYFHGQTFIVDSRRKDVATLLPATFVTATMVANNPGTWMMNCVVDDHYAAGVALTVFNFNIIYC
jgi:FtsP/CotA-like multicopper oxidase with cupredoxin domain